MRHALLVASTVFALCANSPAPAESPAAAKPAAAYDPNERVCEKIEVTGSRLAVRKVCATRAEWAERRRQDRQAIDQIQTGLCVYQGSTHGGRPACNH